MSNPLLDFSFDLLDPMIAGSFDVIRRPEVVTLGGMSSVPVPVTYAGVIGVVNAAGPDDLDRLDDQDRTSRAISIVSQFKFQATVVGYKPDLVVWHGDTYVVVTVDPYPQYGPMFSQAIASSIDLQDVNPSA